MLNYQIPMTGAQITDALTQLVNRVAEGWAVGSRDGNPVSPGSPYYQNNAKDYAEKAAASAARAEAAVPSGTAGAVFFDRSQSLTDAQKAQAQANIGAGTGGGSNKNLLLNPFFTINQRQVNGAVNYLSYGLDCWVSMASTATMKSGEVGGTIAQRLEPDLVSFLVGKTVTVSAMVNGVVEHATGVVAENAYISILNGNNVNLDIDTRTDKRFLIGLKNGAKATACKLELGTVSTLELDAPPNYPDELQKCQYYFRRIEQKFHAASRAFTTGVNNTLTDWIGATTGMRDTEPTLSFGGTINIIVSGTTKAVTNITGFAIGGGDTIRFTSSGLTANALMPLSMQIGAYIDISHEL